MIWRMTSDTYIEVYNTGVQDLNTPVLYGYMDLYSVSMSSSVS